MNNKCDEGLPAYAYSTEVNVYCKRFQSRFSAISKNLVLLVSLDGLASEIADDQKKKRDVAARRVEHPALDH